MAGGTVEVANSFSRLGGAVMTAARTHQALAAPMTQTATLTATNTTTLTSYGTAAGTATVATNSLRGSLIALATHPITLIIMAAAAAFLVLQQNIGGSRDRLSDFGATLGEQIPIIRPFLSVIAGIGADGAVDASEEFRRAGEEFRDMGALWEQTIANVSAAFQQWWGNVERGFDLVVNAFEGFFNDVGNQLGQWIDEFASRLQSGFDNILGPLVGQSQDIAQQIGQALSNFGQWLDETSVDILAAIGIDRDELVSQAMEIGEAIANGLRQGLETISDIITEPLKATQQPGAALNTPLGSSIQDTTFVDKLIDQKLKDEALKRGIIPEGGQFRRAPQLFPRPGQPQTWEDIIEASQPTIGGGGLSPLSAPGTIKSLLELPGVSQLQLPEDPFQNAVLAAQEANRTITTETQDMRNKYIAGTTDATKASLDILDIIAAMGEEFTGGEQVLARLTDAQKAHREAMEDGVVTAEEEANIQRIINGERDIAGKKAEELQTV